MNKQELIDIIAAQVGMSKAQVNKMLDALLEAIKQAVAEGNLVQLIGFGSYSLCKRAARMGRNPKTGAPLKIPASETVKFIPGKAFKAAVNGRK